jgi:hypothetical protein
MPGYKIALFVHLVALFAAFGASTVIHVSMAKIRSASSSRDALEWLGVAHHLSRVFPVALATLVGTGAWMLRSSWSWSAGFVTAGLTGVVLLFVSGAVIEGTRARRLAVALVAQPHEHLSGAAAACARDPLWWCASWANTGLALGVTFAMVAKPSVIGALAAVAVGLLAGGSLGFALRGQGGAVTDSPAARSST